MKIGDIARVVAVVPQGEVTSVKFDENTGEKRILMAWTDADGVSQERWFAEGDLEVVTA